MLLQRKLDEVPLRFYYDLLSQNEEPIKILALSQDKFGLIYQVKELSRKGYGQQKIAGSLKIHPFRVKLALGKTINLRNVRMLTLFNELAEADYQMKTGKRINPLRLRCFCLKF